MRLIDADLLKSDFKDVMPFDIVEINGVKAGLYRDTIIQQVIDEQPTVDAVEVVRCKDCKYRADVDEPNICGVCKLVSNRYHNGEDYCGYGERKDGAE